MKIDLIFVKTGLEMRGSHQSQVDPCVFYRKDSVILTYVEYCVIVSHKQETITSLFESLSNGPESRVLIDEGDISNYLGVSIKKNSYGTFKLLKLHLVRKIINNVRLTVSASLKERETSDGKPVLHKE